MTGEHRPDGRRRRAELRAAVLRLGGLVGWQSREVIVFAEAVTDRPWRCCGCAEFEMVIGEYWAIGRVIQEKRTRRESGTTDREGECHVVVRRYQSGRSRPARSRRRERTTALAGRRGGCAVAGE